jgi:hypothetical protein
MREKKTFLFIMVLQKQGNTKAGKYNIREIHIIYAGFYFFIFYFLYFLYFLFFIFFIFIIQS